ncbi:MAG TPA: hypothetical protein VF889_05930, partial [Bacteroidota bacterium]
QTGYIFPATIRDMAVSSSVRPWYYPQIYLNTRRELEPVFSGAYIGRPLPWLSRDFLVGVTYQYVRQDEKYYDIPQNIYRAVAGYDFNGRATAAATSLPVVDRYSGEDKMRQSGHFVAGYVRLGLLGALELGGRLSRVWFSRAGSTGSSNLWGYSSVSDANSLWSSFETRDQAYSHWDVAGGAELRAGSRVTLGATAGHLWGDATQALRDNDSSYYAYSYSLPYSSYYNRSANTLNLWHHAGKTTYVGGDMAVKLSAAAVLSLFYQHRSTDVSIGLAGGVLDTSYSRASWDYNGVARTSFSQSFLQDVRSGGGSQHQATDRLTGSVQWDISPRLGLSLGAQVEWQKGDIKTSEDVSAASRYASWVLPPDSNYRGWTSGSRELKQLLWTFTSERTMFQIPIFVTVRPAQGLELLFGLNRTMVEWKLTDVTLAVIRDRYRDNNGTAIDEGGFGERYTEPVEQVTDIHTSFMAGLTVAPAKPLLIRLLVVPAFHDTYDGSELEQLQWWIGVTLTP